MLYKQIDRELKTRRVLVVGDMELAEHHMTPDLLQAAGDQFLHHEAFGGRQTHGSMGNDPII